ncbi:MAG: hypothetical protein RR603_04360 [Kurthia sp.]
MTKLSMPKKITAYKEVLELMDFIKKDAGLRVSKRLEGNMIKTVILEVEEVSMLLANCIKNGKTMLEKSDFISSEYIYLSDDYGISPHGILTAIYYETNDVPAGYVEYVDQYNPYHNIFIRVDHDAEEISFMVGAYKKTLTLIEEGFSKKSYVSKPFRQTHMKCVSSEDLERHCNDEFFNPRMIEIGRKVLKLQPKFVFKEEVGQ